MSNLTKSEKAPARSVWDRLFDFDDFFSGDFLRRWKMDAPPANISENNGGFTLELAAPGLNKDDLKVKVENGMLNISSESKEEKKEEDEKWTRQEYSYHSFSRAFRIPESVDTENISAEYKEGMLKVSMPKKASAKGNNGAEIQVN